MSRLENYLQQLQLLLASLTTDFWLQLSWVFCFVLIAMLLLFRFRYRHQLRWQQTEAEYQLQQLANEQTHLQAELDDWQERFAGLEREASQVRDQFFRTSHDNVRLQEKLELSVEQGKFLLQAKEQLRSDFENLANQLLDAKAEKFTASNQANMDQLLGPLRQQLGDFKQRVEDVYDKESKDRRVLLHEITQLKDLNLQIGEEAQRLTQALKSDNKAQGNWGEMVLERVLESSGLRKGVEYEMQLALRSAEGQRRLPDAVIHLPDQRDVVVDAKVSLIAWEAYMSTDQDTERQQHLQALVRSVKAHLKGLSDKDYANLDALNSLGFVLMFIPIEAVFIQLLETEPGLFHSGFDQHVMLVSPSTLMITLKTIHNIWQQDYQNKNAQKIASSAGGLYDQFVLFTESLAEVGGYLQKTQTAYETAQKRLQSGKGNLLKRTVALQQMGARTQKNLDKQLEAQAETSEEEAI